MVLFRQLPTLLCAAVLVCILKPSDSQLGTACPGTTTGCDGVIPNSECRGGACECKQDFYNDQQSGCSHKKSLGDSCTNNDECPDSSHCDGGQCVAITTTVGTTTAGTTTVGTTTAGTTTVGTTTVNITGTNNNTGSHTSVSTGDKLLMISMFLLFLLVNRN